MKILFPLYFLSKLFLVCKPRKLRILFQISYSLLTQDTEIERGPLRAGIKVVEMV